MSCSCCPCKRCCCRKKTEQCPNFEIEDDDDDPEEVDSGFEPLPLHEKGDVPSVPLKTKSVNMITARSQVWNIAVYDDDDILFNNLLIAAEAAIEKEILPQRISQGSSGSYFVRNEKGENIGVFKPRDEEPYGTMNPKWGKWFQRRCCPCCFGRGCLVPNSGYLSEAGAYLVDMKFGLNVVPKTKVIRMASSTFHYGKIRRGTVKAKRNLADKFPAVGKRFHRIGLPLKMGSFQVFVQGYKDAIEWLEYFESNHMPASDESDFQLEFERLVMLDYIIRNTDRGNDNWLIRYDRRGVTDPREGTGIPLDGFAPTAVDDGAQRVIKIAAIDNGLAFPFKHPDEWRAYPFRWAKLPQAKTPFSTQTRDKFLPMFSNITLIEELCSELYYLFGLSRQFNRNIFERQMSVMRGQILNLANALKDLKSPLQLTQMTPMRIFRQSGFLQDVPTREAISIHKAASSLRVPTHVMRLSVENKLMFDSEEYKPEVSHENPVFSTW